MTFINTFLLVEGPWVGISRGTDVRAYGLTPSSLGRLVDALFLLKGRYLIDHVGWTWRRIQEAT